MINQKAPDVAACSNPNQVWYAGTDKVLKGEAFAYAVAGSNVVEKLTTANASRFAGISSRTKTAQPSGQHIIIEQPGARNVYALVLRNFSAGDIVGALVSRGEGNGYFAFKSKAGSGSVRIKEAVTGILQEEYAGGATINSTGKIITVSAVAEAVVAGTKVFVLGGVVTGIVPGEYVVESVTATTITLTESIFSSGSGNSGVISFSAYKVAQRAKVDILIGAQTGCTQYYDKDTSAVSQSGITYIQGGYTPTTHISLECVAATEEAEKSYRLTGDLGGSTYNVELTPGTGKTLSSPAGELIKAAFRTSAGVLTTVYENGNFFITSQYGVTETETES